MPTLKLTACSLLGNIVSSFCRNLQKWMFTEDLPELHLETIQIFERELDVFTVQNRKEGDEEALHDAVKYEAVTKYNEQQLTVSARGYAGNKTLDRTTQMYVLLLYEAQGFLSVGRKHTESQKTSQRNVCDG